MSVDRWLYLLTKEQKELAEEHDQMGECWADSPEIKSKDFFDFGDARDLDEYGDSLNPECDRLQGTLLREGLGDLKELYYQSNFATDNWADIEKLALEGDRRIYFYYR